MFYFETNELGFSPEFMGRVRLVAALASLAGVAVYNTWLKDVPLRRMFLWTAVLGTGLGLTQLILITGTPPPVLLGPATGHVPCLLYRPPVESSEERPTRESVVVQLTEGHVNSAIH